MGKKAVKHIFFSLSVIITALLLAAVIVCRQASYFPPAEGEFWMPVAMLLPVALVVNLVVLVWWLVRRRWLVALMPLAALGAGWGFITAYIPMPSFGKDSSYDIRVSTLNAHGFRYYHSVEATVRAVETIMRREQVDLLCLQEFVSEKNFSSTNIDDAFDRKLPYFVYGGSLAIVSRFPIVRHEYKMAPAGSDDYLYADIVIGADTVRILTVHLQSTGVSGLQRRLRGRPELNTDRLLATVEGNSAIRAEQAMRICGQIEASPYPVILAGDFNDTPSSYTYRRMAQMLTDGFRDAGRGYAGTFRNMGGLLRIDYVFYDNRFSGANYRTIPDEISDHKAVVADIKIK